MTKIQNILVSAADRTALKALTPTAGDVAILVEVSRQGTFVFDSSNLSTRVTADTGEGIYVAPASGATGASGAWVRQHDGPVKARWFGLNADLSGTSGTNDATALNAMSATIALKHPDGCTIDFESLQIYYTANVTFTTSVEFIGNGARTYGDGGAIQINGTLSAKLANVAAAAAKGDKTISVSATAGLAPGDLCILHNHVNESLNKQRTNYYDGEYQEIQSVGSGELTFQRHLETKYAGVSTDEIYRADAITFSARGISFEGALSSGTPWVMILQRVRGARINDCQFLGGNTRSLYFNQCYDALIDGVDVLHSQSGTGSGYGISFGNCQYARVTNSRIHGDNHSVAMGGADTNGAVPCRHIVIDHCHLSNTSITQSTVDIHGNAVDCGYEDNVIYGPVGLSGHRVWARRNKVISKGANAPFYMKEIGGGFCEYSDNEVWFGPGSTANRVIGYTSSALQSLINEDFEIICDRNIIHGYSSLVYFGFVYHNTSRYVDDNNANPEIMWHIRCNDNILKGNISGLTHFLSITATAAASPWTYTCLGPNTVTVNDIKSDTPLTNAVQLAQPVSGSFGRTRYTLPDYAISGTLTISSGGFQSGNLTLDHPVYPAVPECSIRAATGYSGGNIVLPVIVTATASQTVGRLVLPANTMTVSADYARNTQIRVGMRNRQIA